MSVCLRKGLEPLNLEALVDTEGGEWADRGLRQAVLNEGKGFFIMSNVDAIRRDASGKGGTGNVGYSNNLKRNNSLDRDRSWSKLFETKKL